MDQNGDMGSEGGEEWKEAGNEKKLKDESKKEPEVKWQTGESRKHGKGRHCKGCEEEGRRKSWALRMTDKDKCEWERGKKRRRAEAAMWKNERVWGGQLRNDASCPHWSSNLLILKLW